MGLLSFLTGYVPSSLDEVRLSAERSTLTNIGIPLDWVKWFQVERAKLGFGPPDATGLFGQIIFVPILFTAFIVLIKTIVFGFFSFYGKGITGKLRSDTERLIFIVTFSMIIAYLVYIIYRVWENSQTPSVNSAVGAAAAQAGAGSASGFQNPSNPQETADTQYKLVNIQPLAVKQAGFLGPTENGGTFKPDVTIMNSIRFGARFFTLQIDYLDSPKDTKLFDTPNVPTLLYRNSSGKLISGNGATIKSVAEQLAIYAFSPDIRDQAYPIVIYLHFVRTPDPIRKSKEYLKYMMQVAEALQPIHKYILKDTSQMSFRRQQNEIGILELDLLSIEKSIIVLSNADTTLFRNTKPLGMTVGPLSDLDSMINMRVYLESEVDSKLFGVTQTTQDRNPYAIIISLSLIHI